MVNALVSINEVHLRLARLVLGWVTVSGVQLPVRENLSQSITSHPGQLSLAIPSWVYRLNEYRPKGGLTAGEVWFVSGWEVKLCDPLAIAGHI